MQKERMKTQKEIDLNIDDNVLSGTFAILTDQPHKFEIAIEQTKL